MPKPAIIRFDANANMEPFTEFAADHMIEGSRAHKGRVWVDDTKHGIEAGIWEAEAMGSKWMNYPTTEFVQMLEGEVVIFEDNGPVTFKAGESFIIPKGLHCRWTQLGRVKKFYVKVHDQPKATNASSLKTTRIDPKVKLLPSTPPSAEMLHSAAPTQHAHEYFEDTTGQFSVGVWDTTGYHRKLINFPRHELMHLLEGFVTFTNEKGGTQIFHAGDTFFVPLGTPNSWKSEGYLRKIYCIFQPS